MTTMRVTLDKGNEHWLQGGRSKGGKGEEKLNKMLSQGKGNKSKDKPEKSKSKKDTPEKKDIQSLHDKVDDLDAKLEKLLAKRVAAAFASKATPRT